MLPPEGDFARFEAASMYVTCLKCPQNVIKLGGVDTTLILIAIVLLLTVHDNYCCDCSRCRSRADADGQ